VTFGGWKVEALEFFEGLAADNSKAYWDAHKDVYLHLVREPMEELLGELEPEFGDWRLFRPYRDLRFSADKTPYQTHIAAAIGDGYVALNADGLTAGAGMWEMAPDQLARFREAVDDDASGTELQAIVTEARSAGLDVAAHERLKTAPRGYPKDHPRIELLRSKGMVAMQDWEAGAWLGTARAKDRVVGCLRRSAPLTGWLRTNVGPSTAPAAQRTTR
jgi:uncharacterized protein (TIGR02453 family)